MADKFFDAMMAATMAANGAGFTPDAEQLAAINSGIDSTKVAQIETNKNNILLLTPSIEKTAYACTAADTYEYTGISINVPAQQVFELNVTDFSNNCTAIAISDSNSNLASGSNIIAENATEYSVGNAYTWSRQVSCITAPARPTGKLYYIWIKRTNTTSSDIQVVKRRLV